MTEKITRTLASGETAEIAPDPWFDGAMTLSVDRTPQSTVDLDDPSRLAFEYVARMGHVIDAIGRPREPVTALHLGGGALTLPRYIAATRPGSRQQVVEIDRELIDFVRAELPWSSKADIRVRYGDAREVAARLPNGLVGSVDLIVVDVFSGARTPPQVTSEEFYRILRPLLSPHGIVLANIADGPPLAFAKGQAATLREVFGEVAALAEPQLLKGRRFGNIVFAASATPLPFDLMPRLMAAGPHPAAVMAGDDLVRFIGGAAVVTDASATGSPEPNRVLFAR